MKGFYSMNPYDELYNIVVNHHGVNPNMKLVFNGYYLTVNDYLVAVAERGGYNRIIPVIKMTDSENIYAFLKGAATRIIAETLAGNPDFAGYYKDKLKRIS